MFILKLLKILDTTFYPHYCIVFPKAKQPKKEKDDLVGGLGVMADMNWKVFLQSSGALIQALKEIEFNFKIVLKV